MLCWTYLYLPPQKYGGAQLYQSIDLMMKNICIYIQIDSRNIEFTVHDSLVSLLFLVSPPLLPETAGAGRAGCDCGEELLRPLPLPGQR